MSNKERVRRVLDWVEEGIPSRVLKYFVLCQKIGNTEDVLTLASFLELDSGKIYDKNFENKFHVIYSQKNSAVTSGEIKTHDSALFVFDFVSKIMEIV